MVSSVRDHLTKKGMSQPPPRHRLTLPVLEPLSDTFLKLKKKVCVEDQRQCSREEYHPRTEGDCVCFCLCISLPVVWTLSTTMAPRAANPKWSIGDNYVRILC